MTRHERPASPVLVVRVPPIPGTAQAMSTSVRAVISVQEATDVQVHALGDGSLHVSLGQFGLDVTLLMSRVAAQRLRDELTIRLTSGRLTPDRKASA